MKHIIAIGAELSQAVHNDVLAQLVSYSYDARLKDPEKIRESLITNQVLAVQKAATMKLATSLERVFAVNLTTRATFIAGGDDEVAPVVALTAWLLNDQGLQYPDYPRSGQSLPAAFYGLNAKDIIRAIGPDCARAGVPVPLSLWYDNAECYSPYEMLVEADYRKFFEFPALCKLAGLTPVDIGADPQADVRLTIELMTRYGLAPLAVEPRVKKAAPAAATARKSKKVTSTDA